jgi:hypothetical protein
MTPHKPIRSEADCQAALAEIERLWGAKLDTPEGDRPDVLATLIDAYERQHDPIDPPDAIEAIRFRMEQQGLTRKDLERVLTHAGLGDLEPQAQPLDRHDPAAPRRTRHFRRRADPPDTLRPGRMKRG